MAHARFELTPDQWLPETPSVGDVDDILEFLTGHGTFRFPSVASGLFSAAAGESPEFRLTGYQNVWTRDNCHVAYALWITGDVPAARRAVEALLTFYEKSRERFVRIISRQDDPAEANNRPHIRFNGDELEELPVRWSHAQNDALGYVVWLTCKLFRSGDLAPTPARMELLNLFVRYFESIEYWQDEESGHWEETRKIEASSIGTAMAGLLELQSWLADQTQSVIDAKLVARLIEQGRQALAEILPAECIQPDPLQFRPYDAALLFLIYPLEVVDGDMAARIIADVNTHLTGPIGIRRYQGDSYWCANYRDLLAPEVRTTEYSDSTEARDKLLVPGGEAQWCIFDPILSIIHGKQAQQTGSAEAHALQVHHLRRSLGQLTTAESRFPAYRCPESYFLEKGHWIPNDITPLLWTQGNLLMALHEMRRTAAAS